MFIQVLKSKIHRVTVTDARLDYIGSITIDADLLDAAGIIPREGCSSWTTITVRASTHILLLANAVRHDMPQWSRRTYGAAWRYCNHNGIRHDNT